ncbi:helix-turn-helix transcriptional regulator [Sphingomonas sp. PAMC26645]|uniref:helix-turn-helix transcriptional regulator n=1 Tax=Sphingomonas sp. PAMC26645 TaxID=2565555 RepID=UPI00109E0FD2|nr:LuxR C-terminal-related transcriptional regulator [Sphingomonas sp. PAMC26645]QCB42679.1 helix-turn-helix transcriptional regulator [Sphingomonas sp. PAMC26645]
MSVIDRMDMLSRPSPSALAQRWSVAWFELDAQARLVLDDALRLQRTNQAGQRLLDVGMVAPHVGHRLRFAEPASNRLFQQQAALALSRDEAVAALILPFGVSRWVAVTILKTIVEGSWVLLVTLDDISSRALIDASIAGAMFGLTPSELPVFQGVADAVCPKEISRTLNISVNTVRAHLRSIYAKMNVSGAPQAQRIALSLSVHVQRKLQHIDSQSDLFN